MIVLGVTEGGFLLPELLAALAVNMPRHSRSVVLRRITEVLYPQNIYDLIDFSLRKCVQEIIMMRTCKEVGAMRQYLQSHAQDELLKIYRREYKRRFAWIRAGKISQETFSAWSKESQCEKEKCENGEISQTEFAKWLKR